MADRMFTRAGGRGTPPYAPSRNEEISMKRLSQVAVVASLVALAGCYHATIDTGLTPSDRKSTRLNSSHLVISYAVFCLKKKKKNKHQACQQHRRMSLITSLC